MELGNRLIISNIHISYPYAIESAWRALWVQALEHIGIGREYQIRLEHEKNRISETDEEHIFRAFIMETPPTYIYVDKFQYRYVPGFINVPEWAKKIIKFLWPD